MIIVDSKEFKVDVTDIGLDTEFIYKYAERAENYEMKYELGAVFHNQSITFGTSNTDNEDFRELYKILSTKSNIDGGTGHNVEIWTPLGSMTFLMYPDKLSLKMIHRESRSEVTWWTGFTVNFTALKPAESW